MSSAVQELKQIPFAHLIGAPLKAAIESQALAAKTTIDFIKEVGFKPPATNNDISLDRGNDADMGEVRNVTFKYTKKDDTDKDVEFSLTVPILTITPIPYIRIEEMTIDFSAKLTDSVVSTHASATNVNADMSTSFSSFWSPVKVSFRVSSTYKSSTSTTASQKREYKIDIHVRAVQDEMPAGLSKILDILEDAILNAKDAGTS